MTEWTKEWPDKPGMYLFYGTLFEHMSQSRYYLVECYWVQGRYLNYSTESIWIKSDDGTDGWWTPIKLPPLPAEAEAERRRFW